MNIKRISSIIFMALLFSAGNAFAVPETVGVRITDVTASSFSVVWMTDVPAEPAVEVYADSSGTNSVAGTVKTTPFPGASANVAASAREKGIMKVNVSGLAPDTAYYVKTVTKDPVNSDSVGYSSVLEVRTAALVIPYEASADGSLVGFSNDLLTFKIYIKPGDASSAPGLGDLMLLEVAGSRYPVSAFAGEGIKTPECVLDLNNIFGLDMKTLNIVGAEKAVLRIYRAGTFSTLLHYRKLPLNSNSINVSEPVKGFFADINLDGNVDEQDFTEFKKYYRTNPDDDTYNPDYKFVEDITNSINARDFSRFAREYGRTGVE